MKRLYRYPGDGMIGGVCEGLGRYLDIDPSLVRIIWGAAMLCFGVGVGAYIIAWICIPEAPGE
jgi:phage shock protein C